MTGIIGNYDNTTHFVLPNCLTCIIIIALSGRASVGSTIEAILQ